MDLVVATSAFIGVIVAVSLLTLIILLWIYFDDRKQSQAVTQSARRSKSLPDDILERHLEELLISNFQQLFPGWAIYPRDTGNDGTNDHKGIRYRTPAGEIDILCLDDNNNLVVIELKRNRASDTVVSQLERYLVWVEQNLAQPGQSVRGMVIAKKHGNHLVYSASRKDDIELWTYDLKLSLLPKKL